MEEGRCSFKILTGNLQEETFIGRPRRSWEDRIRMDLKEICIYTRNWVDSFRDRDYWRSLVNAALNHRLHELWS